MNRWEYRVEHAYDITPAKAEEAIEAAEGELDEINPDEDPGGFEDHEDNLAAAQTVLARCLPRVLEQLGGDGWELVAAESQKGGLSGRKWTLILKRPALE